MGDALGAGLSAPADAGSAIGTTFGSGDTTGLSSDLSGGFLGSGGDFLGSSDPFAGGGMSGGFPGSSIFGGGGMDPMATGGLTGDPTAGLFDFSGTGAGDPGANLGNQDPTSPDYFSGGGAQGISTPVQTTSYGQPQPETPIPQVDPRTGDYLPPPGPSGPGGPS